MSDFNLALDLGFLTKNRKYTFFKPEFIIWATYLSEKIGYWRYISIYRHLQRNPDSQLYPLFEVRRIGCCRGGRGPDTFGGRARVLFFDWIPSPPPFCIFVPRVSPAHPLSQQHKTTPIPHN